MEPLEFIFDYIIHLFDFIKNTALRVFAQISAMIVLTLILVAMILGITQLILWIISTTK